MEWQVIYFQMSILSARISVSLTFAILTIFPITLRAIREKFHQFIMHYSKHQGSETPIMVDELPADKAPQ